MSEINENLLISSSTDLLYDGMVVQDDIFDSSGDRLLVRSGTVINDIQIERIKRLNSGVTSIYVTGRTHKAMLSKRPDIEIKSLSEVEESSGYSRFKNETFKRLEEIAAKQTVDMESLQSFSTELAHHLESTPPAVIIFLINAMAPVDEYLQRHSVNVGLLNGLIGHWMGMSKENADRLVLIGLLHDCGKILIPTKILNAARELTTVEFEVIKKHSAHTFDLMSEFPEAFRLDASNHHERLNGVGYTRNLSDKNISLEARITAVSDSYDAMVSQRAYKGPQSPFSVLSHLSDMSRIGFDREVVSTLVNNMPGELIDKPVMMSDGTIGVISDYHSDDIEFPTVSLGGKIIKTNNDLYVVSMFNDS